MVHDPRIARLQFDSADESQTVEWNGYDEVSINIASFRSKCVGLGHRDDEVWLAELPPFFPVRNGG